MAAHVGKHQRLNLVELKRVDLDGLTRLSCPRLVGPGPSHVFHRSLGIMQVAPDRRRLHVRAAHVCVEAVLLHVLEDALDACHRPGQVPQARFIARDL